MTQSKNTNENISRYNNKNAKAIKIPFVRQTRLSAN